MSLKVIISVTFLEKISFHLRISHRSISLRQLHHLFGMWCKNAGRPFQSIIDAAAAARVGDDCTMESRVFDKSPYKYSRTQSKLMLTMFATNKSKKN
jgi:hypothetical protein